METEQFYAKTKEGDLLRVTIENEEYLTSPREEKDALVGKMFVDGFINEDKPLQYGDDLYYFIRERLEDAGKEDEILAVEEKADFNSHKGTHLATAELYDTWKKDLCAIVPIDHYEHGGHTIRKTDTEYVRNKWSESFMNGVIYASWDNPNVKEMLKDHTKEETQKWAEKQLENEIYEYNCFLTDEVYQTKVEVLDPYSMQWGSEPNIYRNVYPDKDVPYNEQKEQMIKAALSDTGFFSDTYKMISAEEAQKIIDTPSAEYKNIIGEQFITAIKNSLQQFDNNIDHTQKALALVYQKSDNKMQRDALSAYLKENGCTTKEKTVAFISEKVGIKEQALPQLRAGQTGCTTLVALDRCNQTRGGVVIDYQNKTFALWQGQGDTAYANGSTTKKASWKNCVEKAKVMLKSGFKEGENFNPDARITVKEALKTIKSREEERGR